MTSTSKVRAPGLASGMTPAPDDVRGPAGPGRRSRRDRLIGGSTPLPGRRAMLGALLITGAAVLAFLAVSGGDDRPAERFVVASRDLDAGTLLTDDDLALVALDLPSGQAASALRDPGALRDAVLRGPVAAGALITDTVVGRDAAARSDGDSSRYREVSFAVPRARALSGHLASGDRIDVLATIDDHTEVLVQRALLLTSSDGSDSALVVSDDVVLTVALDDPGDALAVAHGAAVGELTVLRSTRAEDRLAPSYPPQDGRTSAPAPNSAGPTGASGSSGTGTGRVSS